MHKELATDGVERSSRSTPEARIITSAKSQVVKTYSTSDSTILVERDIGDGLTEELYTVLNLDTPTGEKESPTTTEAKKTALSITGAQQDNGTMFLAILNFSSFAKSTCV